MKNNIKATLPIVGLILVVLIYGLFVINKQTVPVLFCLEETGTCTEYQYKDLTSTDPSSLCVGVKPLKKEFCQEDSKYAIYDLEVLKRQLKKACDELHGANSPFNECFTADSRYRFNLIEGKWHKINEQ